MHKSTLIIFFLGFTLINVDVNDSLFAQSIIKGTVTTAKTGKPLPGVNVYLAGTTYGQSTTRNGHYKIIIPSSRSYDLIFSFVGYKKQIHHVELSSFSSITLDVEMEEKVEELEEIEVKASNKEWKQQLNLFFDKFIGRTEYAREVIIENPWVLNFTERNNILIATSEKPIIVINRALGYRLYIELIRFEWPKYKHQGGIYVIYTKYEPLSPEGETQRHTWKKNRMKSYLGSFNHFLNSLYHNDLENNNFSVNGSRNLSHLSNGQTKYQLLTQGVSQNSPRNFKGFELSQRLEIDFEVTTEYQFNDTLHSLSVEKHGAVEANTREQTFFIDKYGSLLDPTSLKVYGSWSDERVANSLPTNYSLDE